MTDDVCRDCGHHRAHHVLTCRAQRSVIGSTPPGFIPRTEPCRCGAFRSSEPAAGKDAGAVNLGAVTAVFLISLVGAVLFLLAVTAGRHGMCAIYRDRPQPPSYCVTGAQR